MNSIDKEEDNLKKPPKSKTFYRFCFSLLGLAAVAILIATVNLVVETRSEVSAPDIVGPYTVPDLSSEELARQQIEGFLEREVLLSPEDKYWQNTEEFSEWTGTGFLRTVYLGDDAYEKMVETIPSLATTIPEEYTSIAEDEHVCEVVELGLFCSIGYRNAYMQIQAFDLKEGDTFTGEYVEVPSDGVLTQVRILEDTSGTIDGVMGTPYCIFSPTFLCKDVLTKK